MNEEQQVVPWWWLAVALDGVFASLLLRCWLLLVRTSLVDWHPL
jgi:hypothetical protein